MKNLLLTFVLLLSFNCFCQTSLSFGFKAGINVSGLHTKTNAPTGRIGFNAGAVARIKFNPKVALQGELIFNQKGGTFFPDVNYGYSFDANLNYINLPVVAQINILKKLKLEIGPEFGFLISENYKQDGQVIAFGNAERTDFGAVLGFSYEFQNRMFLQPRFTWGLSKLYQGRSYGNSCASLSLGYYLN
jgi:hypothetical protein